jgi:hypothetical protein
MTEKSRRRTSLAAVASTIGEPPAAPLRKPKPLPILKPFATGAECVRWVRRMRGPKSARKVTGS